MSYYYLDNLWQDIRGLELVSRVEDIDRVTEKVGEELKQAVADFEEYKAKAAVRREWILENVSKEYRIQLIRGSKQEFKRTSPDGSYPVFRNVSYVQYRVNVEQREIWFKDGKKTGSTWYGVVGASREYEGRGQGLMLKYAAGRLIQNEPEFSSVDGNVDQMEALKTYLGKKYEPSPDRDRAIKLVEDGIEAYYVSFPFRRPKPQPAEVVA